MCGWKPTSTSEDRSARGPSSHSDRLPHLPHLALPQAGGPACPLGSPPRLLHSPTTVALDPPGPGLGAWCIKTHSERDMFS